MKAIGFSIMSTKRVTQFFVAVVLCVSVVVVLRSCVLLNSIASQVGLARLLTSLPRPEAAVLLDEVAGVGGGSDSGCYTAYVYRLYGSDQAAEDIFAFFQGILLSRDEWALTASDSSGRKLNFINRRDGFRLTVDFNLGGYATPGFDRFSERSVAEAQAQFSLPFVVVVNHADRTTREKCWPGWEP